MKISCLVVALLLASLAVAQGQPAKDQPSKGQPSKDQPSQEDIGIRYARMALNVASLTQHQSMDGYLAVFVDDKSWTKLTKDGDLGPFLKLKEQKAERRMVYMLPNSPDGLRVVVYFDGPAATGVAAFTPGPDAKIDADAVKPVPKETLKAVDAAGGWTFDREDVTSDDGDPVPAYRIAKSESRK